MEQKRNAVSRFIKNNDADEDEEQPSKSASDGGDSNCDEEDEGDDEEVEGDDEEVEDDDEEEAEDDYDDDSKQVEDDDGEDLKQVEDEEDFSSKESICKLLEPFSKDQLVEIFKEAALKKPALLSRVLGTSEADRNLFVHGLPWDATSEAVVAAFSPFGKIENCEVVNDRKTGRCKGYAFVLFKSRFAAMRALKNPLKTIGSRITNCQLASSGNTSTEASGRKIIVNNVSDKVNPERLHAFFSQFGEIEKGTLGHDRVTGNLKGFAFFVYKTVDGCNKALEEPKKVFEGYEVFCRRAFDGTSKNNYTQMTSLTATEAAPYSLQAKNLTPTYASVTTSTGQNLGSGSAATLMGQNFGPGPTGWMGQNLGSGTTILVGQSFGPGPTTLMGQSIGPGPTTLFGQNGWSGHFNPAAGQYPALSLGGGIPSQSYGIVSANRGSGLGLNSISPSVIDNYGTLSALHGLGAYQNSTSTTVLNTQPGVGSLRTSQLPPFSGK